MRLSKLFRRVASQISHRPHYSARLIACLLMLAILFGNTPFAHAGRLGPDTEIYYFLHDNLGGIEAVMDEEGEIVERRDYLPFGQDRVHFTDDGQSTDYGFTGKERDEETDLYYYGARYYNPKIGRFVSADPLLNALDTMNQQELNVFLSDPQNLNPYSYVKNNPLRYTDPTGQYEEDVHFGLTYYLAQKMGLDDSALSIAYYNQETDTNPETQPVQVSVKPRELYHFTTQARQMEMFETAAKSLNDKDIGRFLHAYQDSFSHEGYPAWKGHCCTTTPDKTYNDIEKADDMAFGTAMFLSYLAARKQGINTLKGLMNFMEKAGKAWDEIKGTVHEFNKAKTKEEKKAILNGQPKKDEKR